MYTLPYFCVIVSFMHPVSCFCQNMVSRDQVKGGPSLMAHWSSMVKTHQFLWSTAYRGVMWSASHSVVFDFQLNDRIKAGGSFRQEFRAEFELASGALSNLPVHPTVGTY